MILPDELEIVRTHGYGAYGDRPGERVIVRARVEPSGRLVRSQNGTETVAELRVFLPRDAEVSAGDTVRYQGRDYVVLLAGAYRLRRDRSHWELELGPK